MAWFKVDDGFFSSRKVLSIPKRMRLAAVGLWTLAGTWSAKELTDGEVPEYMIEELGGTQAAAEALVAARLWTREANVFLFSNWGQYQPSAASIEDSRAAAKQRQADFRARKAAVTHASQRDKGVSHGVTDALVTPLSQLPDPTRPDPALPVKEASLPRDGEAKLKEQRLPKDWAPIATHFELAKARGVDIAAEADAFRLHAETHDRHAARWNAAFTTWLKKARPSEHPVTERVDVDAENAARDRWLAERGVTLDDYQQHWDDPGWLEEIERKVTRRG